MRSGAKKTFYFSADANALGGQIHTPFQNIIPTQAGVSLPPVGGIATGRTDAFNFEEIISCRSSYTRVSGREHEKDGPWSILVTSVVEGFNILEVVTAEKIVAQLSIDFPRDGGLPRVSLAGSRFEGLRLGGFDAPPALNPTLLNVGRPGDSSQTGLHFDIFEKTGQEQAGKLLESIPSEGHADSWLYDRYGWMKATRPAEKDGFVLCSLVDGIEKPNGTERPIPGRCFGHVVEIPDFGRIFLGELLVRPRLIQLSMVRAELGCPTGGSGAAGNVTGGGHYVPP